MEINTTKEIILDLLNSNSVSVKTIEKAVINGAERVIDVSRRSYANSPVGRRRISQDLPEQYAESILAIWGDEATVEDPQSPATAQKA